MAGFPGEGYASMIAKAFEALLMFIGLKNSPEMKKRDQDKKQQAADDAIDSAIAKRDDKKTGELL